MRVRLESQDGAESVASSLVAAVREVLDARKRAGVSEERIEALAGVLTKMAGSILDNLNMNIRVGENNDNDSDDDSDLDELELDQDKENDSMYQRKDESVGKDPETETLQRDITELVVKLQDYRTRVPHMVQTKVEEELSALRPKDAEDTIDTHEPDDASMTNEEANAKELHDRLLKASKDLPMMREMLESSLARLERTVNTATEAAKARPIDEIGIGEHVVTPGTGGKTAARHAVATKHVRSSPYLKQ